MLKVQNFRAAVQGIATTTLRAVIGDIPLDDVLAKREQINSVLRVKLDDVTQRWGVKVTTVEIREITPPREIQDAMNRQMAAERGRRAAILDAEGKKQAAILVAEGDKQSNILQAEGARQSAILRAEGFALALDQINNTANHADAADDDAPVPRHAEADRRVAVDEVDHPGGVRLPRRAARGIRERRRRRRREEGAALAPVRLRASRAPSTGHRNPLFARNPVPAGRGPSRAGALGGRRAASSGGGPLYAGACLHLLRNDKGDPRRGARCR